MREFFPFNPFEGKYFGEIRRRAEHEWQWTKSRVFRPHWRSTAGRDVIVFPPQYEDGSFTVGLRRDGKDGYCTILPEKMREHDAFQYAERLRRGEDVRPDGDPI